MNSFCCRMINMCIRCLYQASECERLDVSSYRWLSHNNHGSWITFHATSSVSTKPCRFRRQTLRNTNPHQFIFNVISHQNNFLRLSTSRQKSEKYETFFSSHSRWLLWLSKLFSNEICRQSHILSTQHWNRILFLLMFRARNATKGGVT